VREQQGLSLAQLADKVLVRPSLLEAIEAGNLEQLPEPVYIQGLIRRYGEALSINGVELAQAFATDAPGPPRRVSWQASPEAQLRPLHLYILYILLLIASVSGLSYLLRRTAPEMTVIPSLEPLSQPGAGLSRDQASPATNPPGFQPTTDNNQLNDKPVQVKIQLTGQSWVRVVVDGKTEFEGMLQEGDTQTWAGDQEITLRAGNAGDVVVSYNNQAEKILGKPGAVEEMTFMPADQASLSVRPVQSGL
jgi:cytoskeletal protein RodZ